MTWINREPDKASTTEPTAAGPNTTLRLHGTASSPLFRPGLYAITDGPRGDLLDAARAALAGGATLLQYRDKTHDETRRLHEARLLTELCAQYRVPLIVNDDIRLAHTCAAAGVHLGEDDPAIGAARDVLGKSAIIGVSCYDSLQRARDAAMAGADYLAFGAFFPTTSKSGTRHAHPALLRDAREFGLPVVAIGGITPDNGAPLITAGADFLAAISGVFGARDIRAAAQKYKQLFDADLRG